MQSFPGSPRVVNGGLVLVDPTSGRVLRVIAMQYNPDTLTRTFQAQHVGDGADRSEALRLKGPAIETLKLEADIDATDELEFPDQNPVAVEVGVGARLAALEGLINPSSSDLLANDALANAGTLEIAPLESPLVLFTWGANRIVPVRVTEFTITEESFDPALNPIRAKVSLGLRVLTIDDLGFQHRGGSLFIAALRARERLAARATGAGFDALGIGGLP